MIDSRELRLGNLISFINNDEEKVIFPVDGIGLNGINAVSHEYFINNEWLKPVEVSEEILLKVGFVQQPSPFSGIFINGSIPIFGDYDDSYQIVGYELVFHTNAGTVRAKINYLHQLQNLYFALTGQELNTTGL